MPFTTILFDVDETLYPPSAGIWALIRQRIDLYMHDRLGIPADEVSKMREEFFIQYGTTLRGLTITLGIDPLDYLSFVHDIPVKNYIAPAPYLKQVLQQIHLQKVIFTNADSGHASRVISALQIADCFDQIIDILDISPYCKPQNEAFEIALQKIGSPDPCSCIFVDDSPRNLAAAKQLGMTTIHVGQAQAQPAGDLYIKDIGSIGEILKKLGL
jgi:putative hydrolase of the HAD superfamily